MEGSLVLAPLARNTRATNNPAMVWLVSSAHGPAGLDVMDTALFNEIATDGLNNQVPTVPAAVGRPTRWRVALATVLLTVSYHSGINGHHATSIVMEVSKFDIGS